jgi:hypothetical protein
MFPPVYVAVGRPGYATLDSAVSLVLLIGSFWLGLTLFPELGMLSVCWAWLLVYPLLLCWHVLLIRRFIALDPMQYLRALGSGLGPGPGMVLCLYLLFRWARPAANDWLELGLIAVTGLLTYWIYLRWVLKIQWRDLSPKRSLQSPPPAGSG